MKRKIIMRALILLLVMVTCMNCGVPGKEKVKKKVKVEAQNMAKSLVSEDYETFTNYIYPPLLRLMGGKEKTISVFKKGLPNGMKIIAVEIFDCSDTINTNHEIQCTLKERITMKVGGGKLISLSTLIGISDDRGDSWYFIDANNQGLDLFRKQFSNLSERLVISKPTPPVFIKD